MEWFWFVLICKLTFWRFREALAKVEQKENELFDLRRRSVLLIQEKEQLKFQLDNVLESPL